MAKKENKQNVFTKGFKKVYKNREERDPAMQKRVDGVKESVKKGTEVFVDSHIEHGLLAVDGAKNVWGKTTGLFKKKEKKKPATK